MAGSLSDYAENAILRWLFTTAGVSRPSVRYGQLHEGGPGENGTKNISNKFGRKQVTFSSVSLGKCSNTDEVDFAGDNNPSLITHYSLWNASIIGHGQCLGWATLTKRTWVGGTQTFGKNDRQRTLPTSFTVREAEMVTHMVGGLSTYARDLAAKWLWRNDVVTRPTGWYMAVHRQPPLQNGIGGELNQAGATREQLIFNEPVNGVVESNIDAEFGPSDGGWPQISHYTIWDSLTGGNCLFVKPFKAPIDVLDGERILFAAGDIKITAA